MALQRRVAHTTHRLSTRRTGMGAQVKKTVRRRKDFLPHASDSAPISGAHRKDRMPCSGRVVREEGGERKWRRVRGGRSLLSSAQQHEPHFPTLMSYC